MTYTRVRLGAIGYELPPIVVSSAELEARLAPVYQALHLPLGQLEQLTGIHERRYWEEGYPLSLGAAAAARRALERSGVEAQDIEVLIYAGVCREQFEPATACRVAHELGVSRSAAIFDLSNACLGVMNGILDVANRIELGQIRAGLVVSCEASRDIIELSIERMLESGKDLGLFTRSIATLTGGSGAVAVLLTDGSFGEEDRPRLVGGVTENAPEHHELCRWGVHPTETRGLRREEMATDSVAVLKNGVELGVRTFGALLAKLGWSGQSIDRVICHQVGSAHQSTILQSLGISVEKDFATYPFLGNIGTVSLPLTAAIAAERRVLKHGDRVAWLGIGSGLNCLMLGWEW
ncbi:MAG: 3-oxoacyl-ACP synthase III [Planctomycetota bacterium]